MDRRQYLGVAGASLVASTAGCTVLSAPAEFEVASVEPASSEVATGESLDVSTTVRNVGGQAGEAELRIRLGDGSLVEERLTVEPEGSERVTVAIDTGDVTPGERDLTVRVGEQERTTSVAVLEPAAFGVTLDPGSVETNHGEAASVASTVENVGESEGSTEVAILVDGEGVTSEDVTVSAGGEADVSLSVATEGYDPGEYDLAVRAGDDEATGTLVVREPQPEATLVDVGMAQPSVEGLDQHRQRFSVTIENGGDAGEIGYALTFFENEDQGVWHEDATVEGVGSAHFDAGERREESLSESPNADGDWYGFRVWPAEVRAEVRNDGDAAGDVVVALRNGDSRRDATTVTLEPGESTTVSFEPSFAYTRLRGLSVDASVAD